MSGRASGTMGELFEGDDVRAVLEGTFYETKGQPKAVKKQASQGAKSKPEHYDVICISMYREDLARLDETVAALKRQGHRKMSRSALIRFALDQMDTGKLPKSY